MPSPYSGELAQPDMHKYAAEGGGAFLNIY